MSESEIAAALARNDRYLREFVEAHDICPFARRCRETGALERRVLLSPDEAPATIDELCTDRFAHVEVALLLFPRETRDPLEFEHFAASLRERCSTYFIVAFHPESPIDDADPNRLVSFLRRSPDPTLQLVRASVLARVRGRDTSDTVFADPATLDFTKPLPAPGKSLSDRIAEANFETVRKVGLAHLAALLAGLGR